MYRLIIADDEKDIREGLASYFPWQEVGFEVVGVYTNGLEAYEHLKHESVDVILCDILMPKFNGLELAQKLSEDANPVKVVFLTAHRNFEYAQKAVSLGVKEYIVKPTRYSQLFEVFHRLRRSLDETDINKSSQVPTDQIQSAQKASVVINYLKNNYSTATLSSAAEAVSLNPNYFSIWFKKQFGVNFIQYLNSIRLEQAIKLLKDFSLSTEQISEMAGFGSVKSFHRAFVRQYGMTPFEYRNGCRT